MTIRIGEDDLAGQIAEGMHTAFRKATDCPQAMTIHRLISEMPPGEWGRCVRWLVDGIALNFTEDSHEDAPGAALLPGDAIPPERNGGMQGFVVGECGHRVARQEWMAGFRNCERCGEG